MSKRSIVMVGLAVGAVAWGSMAASAGGPRDKATGGGQILIGTRGAGDTIAFTAQNREGATPDFATGQVQYVDRTGGTGKGQTVLHGRVECLQVVGNFAKAAGTWDKTGGTFQLLVEDNGQGAGAGNDMITINNGSEVICEREDGDDDGATALARGNAQVHDAP